MHVNMFFTYNCSPGPVGVMCPPPNIHNAITNDTGRYVGAQLRFLCPVGARFLDGSTAMTTQCTLRGMWTISTAECKGRVLRLTFPC